MLTVNKKDWIGLQRAIQRNPEVVKREAKNLFMRVGSHIDRSLATSPWRVGGASGGVPYATGELLRNARNRRFTPYTMIIFTNLTGKVGEYAEYVHDGTPGGQMAARPYYDVAMANTRPQQSDAINQFLDVVTNALAK
jgi:hypothetical protein